MTSPARIEKAMTAIFEGREFMERRYAGEMTDGAGAVMGVRWRSVVLAGERLPCGNSTRQLVDFVPEK